MVALVRLPPGNQGSILTATVAAELELNSVSPPPDTVEEEKENKRIPKVKNLKESQITLKSTQSVK